MKILKRTLCILFIVLTTLILLVIGGLNWVVHNPKVAYSYLERNYFPKDLKISATKHRYKVKNFGFTSLRFQLDLENLNVKKSSPDIDLPFENVNLDISLEFFKLRLNIHKMQIISSRPSKIHLAQATQKVEVTQPPTLKDQIQKVKNYYGIFQKYIFVEHLNINLAKLEFKPSSQVPMDISFQLLSDENKVYKLITDVKSSYHNLAATADLNGLNWKDNEDFLKLKIKYSQPQASLDVETSMKAKKESFFVSTAGEATYTLSGRKVKIKPDLKMTLDQEYINAKLNLNLANLPGPVPTLKSLKAQVKIPITEEYDFKIEKSHAQISAPIKIDFIDAKTRNEIEAKCRCEFPQNVVARMKSDFVIPNLLENSNSDLDVGHVDLKVDSFHNDVFDINFAASSKIGKSQGTFNFDPKIMLDIVIKSFKRVAPIADYFGVVIPAPLDVLDGTIKLSSGDAAIDEKNYKLPFTLDVDLNSKSQKVKITDESTIHLAKSFAKLRLDNKVTVDDIILELPELSPAGGIPRFGSDDRIFTDARIKSAEKKGEVILEPSSKKGRSVDQVTEPSMKFEMWTDITSSKKNSIQLKSKYFKPHMPLNIKFNTTADLENAGVIKIEPFNVVYLRRSVRLERMKLELNKKIPEKIFVDGRFTVQQSFYKVIIDVNGDSASPNIVLSSEPELSRADIISVLLYDKTRDELVPSDVETAGGVEAAFTVKALGLFSLWALASTPIRSFNYNPVTKVYTATLVLGDGVTAGIGSDWENAAQFELRKRLSKRWVLTGRWVSATTERRERSELILQWESRF